MTLTCHNRDVTDSDTQQELSFLNEAEELLLSILSNTETPAITGTTYFVSNNGDDKNDGKSSETAWTTLEKVSNADLSQGDGVGTYDEGGRVITGGDGFSLVTGITIRDCYIHHNYDNGITIECGSDPGRVVADVTAVGNLIDYNCGGIQIICFDEEMVSHNIMFRDFLIEDNYILHSGESWAAAVQLVTREAPTDDLAAGHSIRLGDLNIPLYAPNTVFKNNVIYSESVCNIWGAFTGDAMPQFIDNQIYVRKDTMVALWSPDLDSDFLWYCIGDENYNSEVLFNQELGSGNIVGYFD